MRLRSHLVLLVVGILLPMIAFSTIVVVAFGRYQRAAVHSGAVGTARALLSAVDEHLISSVTTLEAVATLPSLDRGDLRAFHVDTQRVLRTQPGWLTVSLASPDGLQLVNALRAPGAPLPEIRERRSFEAVLATRRPVIGDLVLDEARGRPDYHIRTPVIRGGVVVYVLTAVIEPTPLGQVLQRQRLSEDWVATIFDRNKRIVARTKNPERFVGHSVSPEFVALLDAGGSEGWAVTHTLEGAPVDTAFLHSSRSGWGIGLGIPTPVGAAPIRRSLLAIVGGGLVFIVLAVALAVLVGRRVTSPIAALASAATRFGERGVVPAGQRAGVVEVEEVRRAFAAAADLVQRRAAEADAATRAKDEFLAVLSHELRTPLNAVYAWARLLQDGKLDAPGRAGAVEAIVRNCNAQVQLIDELLDVSRIVAGKMRLDVTSVDPKAVIEAALDTVRPAAAAKDVRIQSVLDPRAGPVTGDPNRLQQVAWNLLMNAVKFTPKGGRVQIELRRVNSHIEIVVSDTGQGIPAGFLSRIFDPFSQADSSVTRRHGGLGLGLALVKRVVELHGGRVGAESPGEGQGATFTVALPLPIAHPPPGGEPRQHPAYSPSSAPLKSLGAGVRLDGLKVLVVDDERDALEVAAAILTPAGAAVRTCGSVPEALDALRTWRPDVLVSDIEMPDQDGYALIQSVRALDGAAGGRVPAVALTAYGRPEDRVRALAAGYDMHVAKPVDPAELTIIIARVAARPD